MGRISLEKGARTLIIWDINEENIAATVKEFKQLGNVKGYKVDVSDSKQVVDMATATRKECGEIDIVINCAGIVTSNSTFDKLTTDEIERTIKINTIAPMIVAQQFFPGMIERNHGHVCNIASAAGMISNPRMSVYAASKWGVIGWSDSVRIELKQMKSKARFTTIAPYFINTGMFDGVKSRFFPILKPEPTAKNIIRAIEKNKNFKGLPFSYHFIRFCQALLPTSIFDYIFGEVVGIFHAMDNFTGRKK
jgi:short-subunit dehydrogenase